MRFISAHKLTTYLMVGFALLALVLSDELSTIVIIGASAAIVGSWWWEPPRVDIKRFGTIWGALSILVLAYTLVRAFTGADFLIAGVDYLLFLLVAKLFNRNACRDYLHIYAITFLMLVAGTVLNPAISYGACFFGYVISTTWALILFHLRREMEENFLLKHSEDRASEPVQVTRILNSRRIVGRRFFAGTALLSVSVFAVAAMMFLAIPRIGFGLFVQKRRPGITMVGFSDGVQLGGHGTLKNDSTVVMRVKVDEPYRGDRARGLYWRGVAFDEYKRGKWSRSQQAPRTVRVYTQPEFGTAQYHLLYAEPRQTKAALQARLQGTMRQEIYLEPIGYDVLFGASMPRAFELGAGARIRRGNAERNDEIRVSHGAGIKYVVHSRIERPDPALLRKASGELPPGYEVYLQMPEGTPEANLDRVTALARAITQDAPTDYDKVEAVAAWLNTNLSYTLEMRSPGDMEPIDFFLFERKMGHCEYFSSAMAIMLRSLGIPARNVNGFLGGEWNEYDEYVAVRAGDAHSWVEVFFAGVGWVTFDPTPSSAASRLRMDGGIGGNLRRFLDTLRFQWFRWVIEYDLFQQLSMFQGASQSVRGGTRLFKDTWTNTRAWLVRHRYALSGALLLGVMAIAGRVLHRRTRRLARMRSARAPMAALYDQVAARLAQHGHGRPPALTPREHARLLAEADVPGAAALVELTELYYQATYGARDTGDMLARAHALAGDIEDALAQARRAAS